MEDRVRVVTVFIHEYVTGGGRAGADLPASWAAEGAAMRRALVEDFAAAPGVRVLMTLDHRLPDEPGPWTTVRVEPGQEPATFARLAAEADYTLVVAPETDGILADRSRTIEEVGGRSLGASPEAIRLAGDKWATYLRWLDHAVATPPTRRIDSGEPLPDLLTAVVVKPIDGAGSIATFRIDRPGAALPEEVTGPEAALVQPFVPGTPMSASFLVDADGRAHLVGLTRQRVEVGKGRFEYRGGVAPYGDPGLADEPRHALEPVRGLRGWVGVDFLWDEENGRATMLEINPRVTTSYVGLRGALPRGELAGAWLAAVAGWGEFRVGDLAGRVHAARPVKFDADGTVYAKDFDP
jgi:predicted ATP-grasp superfamily ATP-dependent carboligase